MSSNTFPKFGINVVEHVMKYYNGILAYMRFYTKIVCLTLGNGYKGAHAQIYVTPLDSTRTPLHFVKGCCRTPRQETSQTPAL